MSLSDHDESSNSQQNSSDQEDRPLKKARYVTQIKGHYYKQNRYRACNNTKNVIRVGSGLETTTTSPTTASSPPSSSSSTSLSLSPPSSSCSPSPSSSSSSASVTSELSLLLQKRSSDKTLDVWAARQMAKAVVDNTVNRVIEDGGLASNVDYNPVGWIDSVHATRDSARIENAAVMMAIQSHGLQHPQKCTCPEPSAVGAVPDRVLHLDLLPFHQRPPSLPSPSLTAVFIQRLSPPMPPSSSQTQSPSLTQPSPPSLTQPSPPSLSQTPPPSSSQTLPPSSSQTQSPSLTQTLPPSLSQPSPPSLLRTQSPSLSQTKPPSLSSIQSSLSPKMLSPSLLASGFPSSSSSSSASTTTAEHILQQTTTTTITKQQEKVAENNRSQSSFEFDFLEQAVATAILKKGLITATAVDH